VEERPVDEHELRREIEQTREQLGETVEQLAAKTDVKSQARAKAVRLAGRVKDSTAQVRAKAAERSAGMRGQAAGKTALARQKAAAGREGLRARAAGGVAGRSGRRAAHRRQRCQHRQPAAGAAGGGRGRADSRLSGVPVVEKTMIKLIYKPVSLLVSVLGGMLAGAIFKQIWKLAAREEDAPKATDAQRGWREILPAAAMQGAVYALVKAVISRGTAEGTRMLTGVWPGKDDPQPEKGAA
jgi:hypothetical protein